MDLTLLLRTCALFRNLDERELGRLETLASRREFRKGQLIFTEGAPPRGFFAVVTGAVKIFRSGPDGREHVLHVVEAGESFAEAALFMDTYPASAQAVVSPTTVLQIDKGGFKHLLATDPSLSFKIMGSLVKWLAQMRNALTDLTMKEVPGRFASYVLSLPAPAGQPLRIGIPKTTVAQMLGTTKETLSRVLNRLATHRILTYRGQQVRILDRARLQRLAAGEERL